VSEVTRVVIVGAAGRDFHDFNVVYRDDPRFEVVAFTAAQIPDIAGRRYPPALAGPRYPGGIPIVPESELEDVCRRRGVGLVVFAYSDVPHAHVMQIGSRALAQGADFTLLGPTARCSARASRSSPSRRCGPAAASRRPCAGSPPACVSGACASR
jgi:predicted GTPase